MENAGEVRARKVADDLYTARLIARCVCERTGRDWQQHPLMAEPARIIYGDGGQPTFTYARPWLAYSVGGEGRPARMVETRAAGNLILHRVYSPAGVLVRHGTELRGDPGRN
jgi:hypothetical protein